MNGQLIEGVGIQVVASGKHSRPSAADVQKAIDEGRAAYRRRFDLEPTHIALPANNTISLDALNLGSLSRAKDAQGGIIIVGRLYGNGDRRPAAAPAIGAQLELFADAH